MKGKFIMLAGLLLFVQLSFAQTKEILTNKSVSDLMKAGLDKDIVISKIQSTSCKFDLSTTGLVALKKDGVPSDIIKVMQNKADGKAAALESKPVSANEPVKPKGKPVPDIALVNVLYSYDGKANSVKDLEKVTGEIKAKVTAKSVVFTPLGGGPVNTYYRLDGEKSPVRLSAADSVTFVVNSDKGTPDAFTLYRMDSKKGKRETVYEKDDDAALGSNKKVHKSNITFHYVQLGNNIYQIMTDKRLEPGEYCFEFDFSTTYYDGKKADGYAFGID